MKAKTARQDLDMLQGSWAVTALEIEGQKTPAVMLENARVEIKGSRFATTGMGDVYKGTLTLDPTTRPRQLNMKFDAGPEKGNTNLCIYELDGDNLKMCIATRGAVRPSRFVSPPGSGFAVETLVRGVAPAAAAKPKARASKKSGPATEFEGEWLMVSGTMSGQPMKKSDVQWVRRVFEGNQTTVTAGPQVLMKMEFACDSSKSPKTIDYLNTAGANKGKTQYGIYEFEGALLKICVAAPGSARPTQFQSKPGDGDTLTVWKRV